MAIFGKKPADDPVEQKNPDTPAVEVIKSQVQLEGDEHTLELATTVLGPSEIWESKDVWVAREESSLEIWSKMDISDREIVLNIVDGALGRLRDRLNDWVPTSLSGQGGEYLDVSFRVLFAEIERERRVADIQMKKDVEAAKKDVTSIVKELKA